ncbi:unnamed protein product [Clonostachys byssicola]|uniref:Ankyrin n=1 Tax=Clonostachys byssicola TaxID=160290 RepID=A0A9N9UTK4_9HYPO|nr:unnamed protein product [Clonostachys byssicola]
MSPLETLPTEIIQHIAELCTWDSAAPVDGRPSEKDAWRYRLSNGEWCPETYARCHAYLARASSHLYDILNKALYARNLVRDPGRLSCIRWAVRNNRLETLQRAHQYGGDLSSYGHDPIPDFKPGDDGIFRHLVRVNNVQVPHYYDTLATPLVHAVRNGFSDILGFLLRSGADVNVSYESEGFCRFNGGAKALIYPLHVALSHGHIEYAEALVHHGAYMVAHNISAIDEVHENKLHGILSVLLQRTDPVSMIGKLHFAAKTQNLDLLKEIIHYPGLDINARDWDMKCALCLAVQSAEDDFDVIRLLLQHSDIRCSLPDEDTFITPFHIATKRGRLDIIQLLIPMPGAEDICRGDNAQSLLHLAARQSNKELFDFFLSQPDVDIPEQRLGWGSLLHTACKGEDDDKSRDFVQHMIDNGIPLETTHLTLNSTIYHGNIRTAIKILPYVPDAHMTLPYEPAFPRRFLGPTTPLHYTLMEPHPDQTLLVKELIARGVDVDAFTSSDTQRRRLLGCGGTPLFFATVFARNIDCMRLLIDAGADLNVLVHGQAPIVEEFSVEPGEKPSMSLLAGVLTYVWRDREGVVECRIKHPTRREVPLEENMSGLTDRVLLLLKHGAQLGKVGNSPSALKLICLEAEQSSSLTFLQWIISNATSRNVNRKHVDHLIREFQLRGENPISSGIRETLEKLAALRPSGLFKSILTTWSAESNELLLGLETGPGDVYSVLITGRSVEEHEQNKEPPAFKESVHLLKTLPGLASLEVAHVVNVKSGVANKVD